VAEKSGDTVQTLPRDSNKTLLNRNHRRAKWKWVVKSVPPSITIWAHQVTSLKADYDHQEELNGDEKVSLLKILLNNESNNKRMEWCYLWYIRRSRRGPDAFVFLW